MAKNTVVLTDATFDEEVLQAQEPVLVDFSAVWCPPCRVLEPVVEELAGEYAGRVKVAKLDADQYRETVSRYQIRGLPTLSFSRTAKSKTPSSAQPLKASWYKNWMPSSKPRS